MKKTLFFFIFATFCSLAIHAQTPLWVQTNGPSGRWITEINFDSSGNSYVLADNLYRSNDDGATWQILPQTPMAFSTLANGNLIGIFNRSVQISSDRGTTWNPILQFDTTTVQVVNGTNTLIAAATGTRDGDIFVRTPAPLFLRSSDQGLHWDTLPVPGSEYKIQSFYTSSLFAFGDGNGYRSTDRGGSWSKLINGFGGGNHLVGGPNAKMFSSDNNGRNSFWSIDDGRTWAPALNGGLFAGFTKDGFVTSNGWDLERCDSNGKLQSTFNSGLVMPYWLLGALLDRFEYNPNGEVWMSVAQLLFKTSPTSGMFHQIVLPNGATRYLEVSASGSIIASAGFPTANSINIDGYGSSLLFSSSNAGSSWFGINGSDNVLPLAVDSSGLLIGAGSGVSQNYGSGDVLTSSDNGVTWSPLGYALTYTPITSIVVDPTGIIYMGCGEGVFRSTDKGGTWDQLNSGITNFGIQSLAVSATGEVFAGTSTTLYHSIDNALDWEPLPFTPPDTSGIFALTINTAGDLLAAVHDTGIFWSHDKGTTWSPIGTGLTGKVNAMLSTPSGHVFAGTTAGAFSLPAGSSTWTNASSGLGSESILSITRDRNGTVYLGTDGAGVFRSVQTYNSINASSVSTANATPLTMSDIYPNPLSTSGNFSFSLPEAMSVQIDLYNALGQRVKTLENSTMPSGTFNRVLDIHHLPAGVYR
ncbi:MAG TPA: T9SS type A sorting domain-containing protein, partial [Candidatus Kapabacteria bacterium]